MYFEDEFELTAERNPNPGRYIPTEEELEQERIDQQEAEDRREYSELRRAAQNGTL